MSRRLGSAGSLHTGRSQELNRSLLGAPFQAAVQPSNVRSVYESFCSLSEIVHQSLYVMHSPGKPLSSRDLLKIYTQYLNWYDRIPEVRAPSDVWTGPKVPGSVRVELCFPIKIKKNRVLLHAGRAVHPVRHSQPPSRT